MNKENFNKELKEFLDSSDRYSPITVSFELIDKGAFAYRLALLMLKHSDIDDLSEDVINKSLFLIGLEKVDREAREKVSSEFGYQ